MPVEKRDVTACPTHIDAVVVGAGIAGLSAAAALRQAGINTLVLEAADRIGGRCVTDRTPFSIPFDRGGSWLHSAPINPLARLAEQSGATLHKRPWTRSWVHALGQDLPDKHVDSFRTYETDMWKAINAAGAQVTDCTPKSAMPETRWASTAVHLIPQMLAGDADVTSARDTYNYTDAPGDWLVEGGLGTFIAGLHKEVAVQKNCPVTKIDYSGDHVQITTPQGVLGADHVILTVSTGVLAAETIEFTPPLPPSITTAVDMLPCGLLNKIGIEFDPAWAKATQGQMADYHSSEAEFCSLLFGICNSPLAVGFVAGRFADALENQGAGAATDYCLEGLRATFGTNVVKYVLRTNETAWRSDANALGAYSYAKPGGTDARRTLAEPLENRLFFAGEATMTDSYSTVHGAFLSGKRAADQVSTAMTGGQSACQKESDHDTKDK